MTKDRIKAIALSLLYEDDLETQTAAMYALANYKVAILADAENFPPTDEELAEWAAIVKRKMVKDGLMDEEEVEAN